MYELFAEDQFTGVTDICTVSLERCICCLREAKKSTPVSLFFITLINGHDIGLGNPRGILSQNVCQMGINSEHKSFLPNVSFS
jgi:hypothetical protein